MTGRVRRRHEVGEHTVMIARPHAVARLCHQKAALLHVEKCAMGTTSDQDMVDPPATLQRHLADAHQRVAWFESVARGSPLAGFPRVLVIHAEAGQTLPASEESHTGGVRARIEVSEQNDR